MNLLLACKTYGTNDVDMYRTSSRLAAGPNPIELYQHRVAVRQVNGGTYSELFNHPPLVLILLGKFELLEGITGIPFHILLRLLGGAASIATILLVSSLIQSRLESKWNLLVYALSPAAILVSSFHGNTDPFVILFLVATAWSVEKGHSPVLTGLFFSLAFNIKLLPLYVIPALFFALHGARERILCFGAFGLTSMAIWTPYLMQDARAVLESTLGYGSLTGIWGIGYLVKGTIFFWKFSLYAKYAILLLCSFLAWCMNRPAIKIPLFDQFGITLFLFLFLSPGFGVQYLYWLTPWAVILGASAYTLHAAVSGAFLFSIYDWWCRGIPWWYADSITAPWTGFHYTLGLLTWMTVGVVLFEYNRRYPALVPLAIQVLGNPRILAAGSGPESS